MSLFAISDLHLALSDPDKSMEIFGNKWKNYIDRLKDNWFSRVRPEDMVLIAGDVSWATYLDQTAADFEFLNSLPGNKIICKGNHDYWWTTASKLNAFVAAQGFETISFLNNNSFSYKSMDICGTRGWLCPGGDGFGPEDMKIYSRELIRLELSLKSRAGKGETIVMLHYPPISPQGAPDAGFLRLLHKYGVGTCIFGHLHGSLTGWLDGVREGVDFRLVSGDYLGFAPLKIRD